MDSCVGFRYVLKCDQPRRWSVPAGLTTSNLVGGSTVAEANSSTKTAPRPVSPQVEYRDISGWPGYRVGSDGTVWSCHIKGSHGRKDFDSWRLMTFTHNSYGHRRVILQKNGVRRDATIGRLVLEAFIGFCPNGMEMCHGDGKPANDSLDNLRWGTKKENAADCIRHGNRPWGETHGRHKLSAQQVQDIRKRASNGEKYRPLGREYNVSATVIKQICIGKLWKRTFMMTGAKVEDRPLLDGDDGNE